MNFGLFIMTHKPVKNIFPKDRKIMLVGAKNKQIPEGYYSDVKGNNISDKNKNFCELTGLYNVIFNDNDYDIIGLEHYRRLFLKSKWYVFKFPFLKQKDIEKIMQNYDVIMPPLYSGELTLREGYANAHIESDLDVIENIIKIKYPEYLPNFQKVMNGRNSYYFNMFIAKKQVIVDYAKWLFDILFEAEKRIDISQRDDYQARVFGFLSERLFDVYLDKHNELKICEKEVVLLDGAPLKKQFQRVKNKIKKIFKKGT